MLIILKGPQCELVKCIGELPTMAGTSLQASSRKPAQPRVPSAVEQLCQATQPYRSADIDKSLVAAAVSELNSKDHAACSRLDSKASSTIIQVLLECHDCHHSERGIYLLGVSAPILVVCLVLTSQAALFHDSHSPSKKRSVKKKKEAIGTECLHLLLDFFIDGTKRDSMRQWVCNNFVALLFAVPNTDRTSRWEYWPFSFSKTAM
jgi:hypothetical protein